MIQRYNFVWPGGPQATMQPNEKGTWVKYADIEKAIKEAYENGKQQGYDAGYVAAWKKYSGEGIQR